MSKRFSDTEIWRKKWFRKLPPRYKCFWRYILDNCDLVGIWDVDLDLAQFQIGEKILESEIKKMFKKQIIELDEKRWFIPDFVEFQYGKVLKIASPIHKKVIEILSKYGLYDEENYRVSYTLCHRVGDSIKEEDKVIDKDKEKEKDKEEPQKAEIMIYPTFDDFWNFYNHKYDRKKCETKWNKLSQKIKEEIMQYLPDYIKSTPNKKYRKHPATFLNNESWNNEIVSNNNNTVSNEDIIDAVRKSFAND